MSRDVDTAPGEGLDDARRTGSAWRFWVIAPAVVVCGVLCGWLLGRAEYRAAAVIDVRPRPGPAPFPGRGQTSDVLPMFAAFVRSHAALVRSQRVISSVAEDPRWNAAAPLEEIAQRLTVTVRGRSALLDVAFDHASPVVALRALELTTEHYRRLADGRDSEGNAARIRELVELGIDVESRLEEVRRPLLEVTGGATYLEAQAEYRTLERAVADLRTKLDEFDVVVEMLPGEPPEELRGWRHGLEQVLARLREDLLAHDAAMERAYALQLESEELESRLDSIRLRLESLELENAVPSRVRLLDAPHVAAEPVSDTRPAFAAGGGLLALMLSFGGIVGMRRRPRNAQGG